MFLYCSKTFSWNVKKSGKILIYRKTKEKHCIDINILMIGSNDLDITSCYILTNKVRIFKKCLQVNGIQMKNTGPWELKEKNSEESSKKKLEIFRLKFKKIKARVSTAIDLSGSTITSRKFCLLYLKANQLASVHELLSVMCMNHQLCDFFSV